jgi:hypothetical protein
MTIECGNVPPIIYSFTEEGSHTWTLGSGFVVTYYQFSVGLSLNTEVSDAATNVVTCTINRTIDNNQADIKFGLYTADVALAGGVGGIEFHIWDNSGYG